MHKWPETSSVQCCPMACLMYFDAGVSEYGLIFKRGTKVASLLKQGLLRLLPWSHFLHVTSAEQFTLSQNSTEAAQKKFKSLACVAVPDTCSSVLAISLSSSSLERQLLAPPGVECCPGCGRRRAVAVPDSIPRIRSG